MVYTDHTSGHHVKHKLNRKQRLQHVCLAYNYLDYCSTHGVYSGVIPAVSVICVSPKQSHNLIFPPPQVCSSTRAHFRVISGRWFNVMQKS